MNRLSNFKFFLNRNVVILFQFLFLAFAFYAGSRAFAFGYIISIYLLIVNRLRLTKTAVLISVALLLFIFCLLIFYKWNSSLGRILIYKVSSKIFTDHLLMGVGWGNFKLYYLYYQADYFGKNAYSLKEFLLADNTQHAFNDYWEYLIETGITGLTLALTLLWFLRSIVLKHLRKIERSNSFILISHQLMAFLIAAFFTHVFEIFYFKIIFLTLVGLFGVFIFREYYRWICTFTLIIILITTYRSFGERFFKYKYYQQYDYALISFETGSLTESLNTLKQLYPVLKMDNKYLLDFAAVQESNGNYNEANKIITLVLKKNVNSFFYNQLAENYNRLGLYKLAEKNYLISINMVPNKFVPKYNLYKLYLKLYQIKKAEDLKKIILTMPIKIKSPTIDLIKQSLLP